MEGTPSTPAWSCTHNKTYSLHKTATRTVTNPPAFAHPQQMRVMDITGNFRQMPDKCSSTAKTNSESLPEQQLDQNNADTQSLPLIIPPAQC